MSFPDYVSAQRTCPAPPQGLTPVEQLLSLESFEPHRVNLNGFVVALEAMPAVCGATSHDVATRLMFYAGPDPGSPGNRRHPDIKELWHHCTNRQHLHKRCCVESTG